MATGTTVAGISSDGERLIVIGTPDFERHTDLVLVAVGVRPATELAETAGANLGHGGAVSVDRGMRTAVPGVYAAGDCAETWHRLLERPAYLPLGTTAHKQGRVAGENAVGGRRDFAGSLGTQVVKVFDLAVARTGLRQEEAIAAGFEALTTDVTVDDHKAYYPGAVPLRIRLTGDRSSGRLLGAQTARGPERTGGQARRHLRHRHLSRHDGGGTGRPRPGLHPSLLQPVGPCADCRPGLDDAAERGSCRTSPSPNVQPPATCSFQRGHFVFLG